MSIFGETPQSVSGNPSWSFLGRSSLGQKDINITKIEIPTRDMADMTSNISKKDR